MVNASNAFSLAITVKFTDADGVSQSFELPKKTEKDKNKSFIEDGTNFEKDTTNIFFDYGLLLGSIVSAEITSGPTKYDHWSFSVITVLNHNNLDKARFTNEGAEGHVDGLPHIGIMPPTLGLPAKLVKI